MKRFPCAGLVLLVAFLTSVSGSSADTWSQWRGDSQDGALGDTDVFSQPFGLRLAWNRPIGSGYSGISIVNGRVVTQFTDGDTDFVGAFALDTGEELWRRDLGPTYKGRHGSEDGPSSTPAISGGRVFVVSARGRLAALDLGTGERLWEIDLIERHSILVPWYGFGTSPVAVDDVVFIAAFSREGRSGFAFDASSGELAWSVDGNWLAYQSAVESRSRRALLVSDSNDLAQVDIASGSEIFRFTHSEEGDLTHPQLVPVGSDRLLLTYDDHVDLYRVNGEADPPLEHLWRSRELKEAYAPPTHHGGTIYGLSGTFLVAIDAATGERLWKSRRPGLRALIVVDGHLVGLASSGEVVVAEANRSGYTEVAAVAATDRGGFTPPSFSDGRILVRNTSDLACVEVVGAPARTVTTELKEGLAPAGPFRDFLARLERADRPSELLDSWWRSRSSFPLIENDSVVHFVYRGPASEVALIGDMTADLHVPEPMHRVGDSDLFYRSYEYEPGGLWGYSFLLDLERVTSDAMNPASDAPFPAQNPTSVGFDIPDTRSIVAMPGWEVPGFLGKADIGGRIETLPFQSPNAYRKYDLSVYLPRGYDEHTGSYPALYVLGSNPWLEHAGLSNALDNLMGSAVDSAVVVLIPYHDGSLDRMGSSAYSNLILEEIVPLVEEHYRVRQPSALLAAGDDAASALVTAMKAPEKFPRFALHSPRIALDEHPEIGPDTRIPEAAWLEWSSYEPRIADENTDYRALAQRVATLLRDAGTSVVATEVVQGPGWTSWSSRLDQSLAFLLPRR